MPAHNRDCPAWTASLLSSAASDGNMVARTVAAAPGAATVGRRVTRIIRDRGKQNVYFRVQLGGSNTPIGVLRVPTRDVDVVHRDRLEGVYPRRPRRVHVK